MVPRVINDMRTRNSKAGELWHLNVSRRAIGRALGTSEVKGKETYRRSVRGSSIWDLLDTERNITKTGRL